MRSNLSFVSSADSQRPINQRPENFDASLRLASSFHRIPESVPKYQNLARNASAVADKIQTNADTLYEEKSNANQLDSSKLSVSAAYSKANSAHSKAIMRYEKLAQVSTENYEEEKQNHSTNIDDNKAIMDMLQDAGSQDDVSNTSEPVVHTPPASRLGITIYPKRDFDAFNSDNDETRPGTT